MNSLRPAFEERGFDEAQWKRHMHRYSQEYVRRKLWVVKAYAQQTDTTTILIQAHITPSTLRRYIKTYTQGGLEALCQPEKRAQPKRLTPPGSPVQADFARLPTRRSWVEGQHLDGATNEPAPTGDL